MKTIKILLLIAFSASLLVGCDTEMENIVIQKPYKYDDQYYANLRAYKKTDHTLAFGWYAAYAPLEGMTGYKDPASMGERIMGLPDSLDVVSLWMGIPGNDPNDLDSYAPVAYADWKFVREVKGTRFIATNIVRLNKDLVLKAPMTLTYGEGPDATVIQLNKGDSINLRRSAEKGWLWEGTPSDATDAQKDAINDSIRVDIYTDFLIQQVVDNDLDGLDFDYEPEGDRIAGALFTRMVKRASKYFGPMSKPEDNPDGKMLIIDFYNNLPQSECGKYVTYYIRQAYTQGGSSKTAAQLQSSYDGVANAIPPEKYIVTEQMSLWYATGGSPFTEADGNRFTTDGTQMYSLEGMARWNPTQGRKGGFGGFYFDRDYHNASGPYYSMRKAIQAANPAQK